jgi:hypothetical protein
MKGTSRGDLIQAKVKDVLKEFYWLDFVMHAPQP